MNPEGELVSRFGRSGEGPGEFDLAFQVIPLSDGGVVVPDAGHTAFHIFGPSGGFERMVRFSASPSDRNPLGVVAAALEPREFKADRDGGILSRITTKSEMEIDTIGQSFGMKMTEGPRQVERVLLDGEAMRTEVVVSGWTPLEAAFGMDIGVGEGRGGDPLSMSGGAQVMAFVPQFFFDALPGGGVALSGLVGLHHQDRRPGWRRHPRATPPATHPSGSRSAFAGTTGRGSWTPWAQASVETKTTR